MICPSCGTANEAGRKFCGECGTKLAAACPACGTANAPGVRFCGECGTRLDGAAAANGSVPVSVAAPAPAPTERRVVTVLFADLVGFTTRSDGQDPEQVREFLARYFDVARDVVERFGGVVEKFIGDAVMAVWGARSAREDDAERAVRAALDLVESVALMGRHGDDGALALRAGVLTGEAAVSMAAGDQALVAGDLVNTASRLQSVAPPGTVLVGESTYRLADRAIAFQPAGEQLLKGKAAPVPAWRALRVVAERGGLGRSEGIEAPFVGRDDQLRLLKDLLHATGRERRVRLVSVTGQAGMGKSRLAWEFLKYIDGVLEPIYWHQGRSPAFGEGVTFWALGEMVRRRAKLAEGDDEATTRARITEALQEYVTDEAERVRIEPVLLALLGVGDLGARGREELFPSIRVFFERISIQGTTVLVFEDLQWADSGVIDFINHLLEWSIGYPILVVTLARPELLERRPDWGAGRRDFIGLSLGPLDEAAMRSMLVGLVPELPESALRSILARADGIPLYAVEMVRMLNADGRLREDEGVYRVVGDLGDLRVPDTLQSLIASRLDGLEPRDRAIIQDAAVLGQTFDVDALAAITGDTVPDLEARLRPMVRRELLRIDTDPRSPERGQYGFTQALIREVAYATLSKRDRRTKHLAAARYYESLGDDEVAGVLATHYVDAWAASPTGPDGEAVAGQARIALRAAADRATTLGSLEQAVALLRRAREVTTDPAEDGELLERIGIALRDQGRYDEAIATLGEAIDRARGRKDRVAAARSTALLGASLNAAFRAEDAAPILKAAVEEFEDLAPDPAIVLLWATYARAVTDDEAIALEYADRALAHAERQDLVPIVADTLVTKGSVLAFSGRWREGTGLLEIGQRLASAHGLGFSAARAANNLVGALIETEPERAVQVGRDGIVLARRYGLRGLLVGTLANTIEASLPLGSWHWIDAEMALLRLDDLDGPDRISLLTGLVEIEAIRGANVADEVAVLADAGATSSDPVARSAINVALAIVAEAEGRFDAAHTLAVRAADLASLNEPGGMSLATAAAIRLGDLDGARTSLERLRRIGARGPALRADVARFAAGIEALEGRWAEATVMYQEAWRQLRELRLTFSLARSQLEYLSVAAPGDPAAEAIAGEVRTTLSRIGARAYVRQLDELLAERAAPAEDRTAPSDRKDGAAAPARSGAVPG